MGSKLSLEGGMIPRNVKRTIDHRDEERIGAETQTAMLEYRGQKHVVRLVNLSPSGAMIIFSLTPNIGEEISLQLQGHGRKTGRVVWVRDGCIGVTIVAGMV